MKEINRSDILDELERNSFVVIPDVISNTECNKFIKEYREWYGNFKGKRREFLRQRQSVVQNFWVGHLEASWKIRLKVKPIFEKIWETTQLLTSVDGVAISAPPEEETEGFNMKNPEFRSETDSWLHLDQGKSRVGRHAIQGAVYLETSSSDDYCFRVMKGSENYHREFLNKMRPNIEPNTTFIKLKPHEISWFEERGCETTFVEVPKGGMILWDSRTVHDNLPPRRGRSSGNRWRHVCFVTMTPAKWAGPEDLEVKKRMYNERLMSSHWASQGIKILGNYTGRRKRQNDGKLKNDNFMEMGELPTIAQSDEVKQLLGVKSYDFLDGPPSPKWISSSLIDFNKPSGASKQSH